MKLLALRVCAHDSNITYYDGEILRYRSFERDLQIKHFGFQDTGGFFGWTKILHEWNIVPSEVDAIGIVLDTTGDVKCEEGLYEIPHFKDLGFICPIHRVEHHHAHSLSLWPLGVTPNIHFVLDGFGDNYVYRSVFRDDKRIDFAEGNAAIDISYCSSLGFIMTRMGAYLGLEGHHLDQAGKVMAIKALGEHHPEVKFVGGIDNLSEIWNFTHLDNVRNDIDRQYISDWIHTAHEYTEKVYLDHFLSHVKEGDVVGYSGGIAQNTIINKVLRDKIPNLVIPPHCNDQGLSLGIIEYLRLEYGLPPFDRSGFPFWQDDQTVPRPSSKTIRETAERLARGEIVGWYQGHGEIGPRALGNRSVLMSPLSEDGKDIINSKVKHREWFRPFGASVLDKDVSNYFDWEGESPYMLYVADVKEPDRFPSITHFDGTCRMQTVSSNHEDYYQLIEEFESLTGVPMLLNTSLNNGGRPIAGRIADALELYYQTELDTLVLGDSVHYKQ
jgi:carbamoyltransferase